jgi:enhancer of polycomb-like protein
MSKVSFRARALDFSKPMAIYRTEEIPDLRDYDKINRAVLQMPTGMEKEEETVSILAFYSTLYRRHLGISARTIEQSHATFRRKISKWHRSALCQNNSRSHFRRVSYVIGFGGK